MVERDLPESFYHALFRMLYMKVSPVIEYLPVSPVAPPNSTTLALLTIVIVWPKRACGISPLTSSASTH